MAEDIKTYKVISVGGKYRIAFGLDDLGTAEVMDIIEKPFEYCRDKKQILVTYRIRLDGFLYIIIPRFKYTESMDAFIKGIEEAEQIEKGLTHLKEYKYQ